MDSPTLRAIGRRASPGVEPCGGLGRVTVSWNSLQSISTQR